MKVRTDYVSNSSSSSFILAGGKRSFVAKFKLKKRDFVDAIIDLSGGKAQYDEYVVNNKRKYWNGSWFEVYDKKLASDKKTLASSKTEYLKQWHSGILAYNAHGIPYKDYGFKLAKWNHAYEALRDLYHLPWDYDFDAKTNWIQTYDKDARKWIKKAVPKNVDKVVRDMHAHYGVMSNYDVLMLSFARFLFHFGDNDIFRLEGTRVPGKNEDKWDDTSDYVAKRNKEIDNSIYESDSHSIQRVCEVLFNWLKQHGKLVGLKDETWTDLYDDVLACTMHEG